MFCFFFNTKNAGFGWLTLLGFGLDLWIFSNRFDPARRQSITEPPCHELNLSPHVLQKRPEIVLFFDFVRRRASKTTSNGFWFWISKINIKIALQTSLNKPKNGRIAKKHVYKSGKWNFNYYRLQLLRYMYPRSPGFTHRLTHINGLRFMLLGLGFMFLWLGFSTVVFRFRLYVFGVRVFSHCFWVRQHSCRLKESLCITNLKKENNKTQKLFF